MMVLGPSTSDGRQLGIKGPLPGVSSLHVTAADATMWSWNITSYCHRENPDQTPISIAIADGPESMEDVVKRMIQTEFSKWAMDKAQGTFEEEDDFDIDEDPDDFVSKYEFHEMQEEAPIELQEAPPEVVASPPAEEAAEPPQEPENGS